MTNSEKQTKRGASRADEPTVPAYATGEFWSEALAKNPALVFGASLLVVGWVFILHINRWHFTVPVFMLWMGWGGVLATTRFMWRAGFVMASDTHEQSNSFDVSASRHRELIEEKKALLRAIKEIEFDRDLGKMSPEDAKEIMRFYRARAIAVIKEIDGQSDAELTVPQRIERDLQARLAVETKAKSKSKKASPPKEDEESPAKNSKDSSPEKGAEEDEQSPAKNSKDSSPESEDEESAVEDEDASVESA